MARFKNAMSVIDQEVNRGKEERRAARRERRKREEDMVSDDTSGDEDTHEYKQA